MHPIDHSLPPQAKEMFMNTVSTMTLEKLQDRLAFQQLHLETYLGILAWKASELKSRS